MLTLISRLKFKNWLSKENKPEFHGMLFLDAGLVAVAAVFIVNSLAS